MKFSPDDTIDIPTSKTVSVSGRIYAPSGISAARDAGRTAEAGTGNPLAGATVTLNKMNRDGNVVQVVQSTATSGNDGSFTISGASTGDNLIVVATANVSVNGENKTLKMKKHLSINDDDMETGAVTGLEVDVKSTLTVAAMKDILETANTGLADSEKLEGEDIPREILTEIESEVDTALTADQAGETPAVDTTAAVTGETAGAEEQLANLENTAGGVTLKTMKQETVSKGFLRVHVITINEGYAISDATVVATIDGSTFVETTDSRGEAFFEGFTPGVSIEIEVIKSGYEMVRTSQNIEHAAMVHHVTVKMEATATNQAPVAKAGEDKNVLGGSAVTLDGSDSFDPDGDSITFAWSQSSGPNITLNDAASPDPSFTPVESGSYVFSLTVSDGVLSSTPDTVTITVTAVACSSDSDCNDGNALTIDSCTNPGTSGAACSNVQCSIACSTNNDCDDSDSLTEDVCTNAASCNASCSHTSCTVACSSDTDCDDSDSLTIDTCTDSGTCDAACSNVTCTVACSENTDCNDDNVLTTDTCTDGGTCDAACSNVTCAVACSANSDCNDDNVLTTDTCSNAGKCDAACSNVACTIACTTASDCADSDPLTINETCSNSGTCNAACTSTSIACASDTNCDAAVPHCLNAGLENAACVQCVADAECGSQRICSNNTCVYTGGDVGAGTQFYVPRAPTPPRIISVTNTSAVEGSSVTVYADIQGQTQWEYCCNGVCESTCTGSCDFSSCAPDDFYRQPDPRVAPNPPCIPNANDSSEGSYPSVCGGKSGNPRLFYYYNGDPTSVGNVDMSYDSTTGRFTADVPTSGLINGDVISIFIIASDSAGNVVSQVPDDNVAPCTTLTSWDSNYESPAVDNCANAVSYERCGDFVSGTQSCYSSDYTVNDSLDDTCDIDGNLDSSLDLADIYGLSIGSGKGFQSIPVDTVVCSNLKMAANPPDVGSSSGPIDAYFMFMYNPDQYDANPADTHVTNSYIISYMPEMSGADPNLVKVLWDGDCLTDPNTSDPLDCKLIIGSSEVNDMKIGAAGGEMKYIVKNSLPDGNTLIGSESGEIYAILGTGDIDLRESPPFWNVDTLKSVNLSTKKTIQYITLGPASAPAPPLVDSVSTCTWPDSTEFTNGTCSQSSSQPSYNQCDISIYKSPDSSFTDEYKVYRNTVNDSSTATSIGTVTSNRDGLDKSYTDTISTLDGKTYYYWVSSVNVTDGNLETPISQWASTQCTVEDWVAPDAVTGLTCDTPDGTDDRCECAWSADTSTDPSIVSFDIMRDGVQVNTYPITASPGETDHDFLDLSGGLITGQTYNYEVTATDAGGNTSSGVSTSCTLEDLRSPAKVNSLIVTLVAGAYSVDLSWNQDDGADVAGYNAYYCKNEIMGYSCVSSDQFTQMNTSLITGDPEWTESDIDTDEYDYCFWISACDSCDTSGTCPSTGTPNCSGFSTVQGYLQCLVVTTVPDAMAPLYPDNTSTQPGDSECEISWDQVCEDEEGAFASCEFPDADELVGYYIMRAESSTSDCASVTMDTNPVLDTMGQNIGSTSFNSLSFTDTGLTNGTTYCYRVHAFDSGNNYSREDPAPDPVACTPTQ